MASMPAASAPLLELTYNWDAEDYGEARYFGHLAFEVDDIYAVCDRMMKAGVTINRPPRDGMMAFVRSPDKQSIELLQKGDGAAARGALEVDAEYGQVVGAGGVRGGCGQPIRRADALAVTRSIACVRTRGDAALKRRRHRPLPILHWT